MAVTILIKYKFMTKMDQWRKKKSSQWKKLRCNGSVEQVEEELDDQIITRTIHQEKNGPNATRLPLVV